MDHFEYRNGQLYAENVAVTDIARAHGTPCYIYSRATLERHWHAFNDAFGTQPHLVCYAVKANSNIAILNLFARLGSGFDIVSAGELERVLRAGGDPSKVVFSGVGKKAAEIRKALEVGIRCFNVESEAELDRINAVAGDMGKIAPISLRVNPDVDAQTHPYISTGLKENKFGIEIDRAETVYVKAAAMPHLNVVGIDCHIGSQLLTLSPFMDALQRVLALAERLAAQGIHVHHLDIGGGLGVRYREGQEAPSPADYMAQLFTDERLRQYEIFVEPGRAIAANAGILVTEVEFLKLAEYKNFAVVDAAMNDLIRPALYSAWQEIIPVIPREGETSTYDIVGPVCETGDFLGKERDLTIQPGDLLAVRSSGAYGFTMSSNYNTRPRAVEVMVDGDAVHVVRNRETLDDLLRGESVLP
ncbi:MAG TPA: diaminopimelate decarboxylase [Candidatus Thiothrix moscowensis]|uniref:diaminopimelate decarboxylase n=1 Tax=unclassified Thiothrix TaxID=2636184 RepID=UPI0025E5418B|nr:MULTISPECIES: diaminopimelate decarboxylase [unclassified Thiothrix]HRJ53451.1 diaminopimelate decarboxylase [Candidatus Thiothrix moscowensis]HRJ93530.1 diaminopimelate decarboxylase [Candidatus Thiothrix moscowensis]